jgi:hypothetical protein
LDSEESAPLQEIKLAVRNSSPTVTIPNPVYLNSKRIVCPSFIRWIDSFLQ